MEITSSGNHGRRLANAACTSRAVARATPKLSKTLHFVDMEKLVHRRALCLYSEKGRTCAMPSPELLERRPSCPYNADPT